MRTRAIVDKTFLEEEEEPETLREFMRRTAKEKFVDNLPLDTLKVPIINCLCHCVPLALACCPLLLSSPLPIDGE